MADKIRLDKWLWAARFYKTRGLAKQNIEGGKVHYNSARSKPSKEVIIGDFIRLHQGWDLKTVEVLAVTDKRRGAPEAELLYRETQASIEDREKLAAQRKQLAQQQPFESRPSKKDRRQIHRFKRESLKDNE